VEARLHEGPQILLDADLVLRRGRRSAPPARPAATGPRGRPQRPIGAVMGEVWKAEAGNGDSRSPAAKGPSDRVTRSEYPPRPRPRPRVRAGAGRTRKDSGGGSSKGGDQGTTMTGQCACRASQPGTEPATWCHR
jgi:hypothetical protein